MAQKTFNEHLIDLYEKTNELLAKLGSEGEIYARQKEVSDLMDALYEIDGGVYDIELFKRKIYKSKDGKPKLKWLAGGDI